MKIGKNELCPCGSGKKYEDCCMKTNLGRILDLKGKNAENFVYQLSQKSFFTDWWKDHLGPDWQRVHNDLKDTIGNLTFVAKPVNPSLSNQPFTEKKKWFMKTKVELSASFKPLESWREKDIVERAEALSKQAIQIWEYPS